jgi:hypothetical protein
MDDVQLPPLEELRWHWGTAYDIHGDGDRWTAVRRDTGATLEATTPDELFTAMHADYFKRPVPRGDASFL